MRRQKLSSFVIGVYIVAFVAASAAASAAAAELEYAWFAVPIEVTNVPVATTSMPVTVPIDFASLLKDRDITGPVDERSLHLIDVSDPTGSLTVPCQWTPQPKPRITPRRLLPTSPPSLSVAAEFAPDEPGDWSRVSGDLTWIVGPGAAAKRKYVLRFAVAKGGSAVQVPFPPQNLRVFDARGRAPSPAFPHMQIVPERVLDGAVRVTEDGKFVTAYRVGPTDRDIRAGGDDGPLLRPSVLLPGAGAGRYRIDRLRQGPRSDG